jgi:hypothetical protein
MSSNFIETGIVGRSFPMRVERTYSRVQVPTHRFYVIYSIFRDMMAKLSRNAKQETPTSAHPMRQFVRGLSINVYQPSSRSH